MRLAFTKLDDKRYRLEVRRADGAVDAAELETRSVLLHDLVHYAVEAQAGLEDAFYGRLAAGATLAQLGALDAAQWDAELALAEQLVGPLQSLYRGHATRSDYLEQARRRYPDVVDEAFVDAVFERLRHLVGHWKATPFGGTMELPWPPEPARSGH